MPFPATTLLAAALFLAAVDDAADALARARSLRLLGEFEQAVAVLDESLGSAPDHDELEGLLGLCLLDLRRSDRARELAERRAGYDGRAFQMFVFLGRYAAGQRDDDTAVEAFRAALARKDGCVEALVHLISIDLGAERYGRALKLSEQLAEGQPDLGRRFASRALVAQGDQFARAGPEGLGYAIDKYREALARTPEDAELAERLLDALVLNVRLDEARQLAAELYPGPGTSAARHYWEGQCAAAAQDVVAARAAYALALAADPEHGPAALGMARLCLAEGDAEGARGWLERSRESMPESSRLCVLLGEALVELDELGEAETWLRRALATDPDNLKALYQLGRLLARTGRRAEGAELLTRLAELQQPPPLLGEGPGRDRRQDR